MSGDFGELTQLFRDSLIDRFGLEKAMPGGPRLCFALGTPLPDDGFRGADGAYFPLRALEFMSHHCNVAPRIVGEMFFPTINEVDDLYGMLLLGASPAAAADVELLGAVRGEAKTAFDSAIGSTIPPGFDTFRPTPAVPENWYDQTKADNWSAIALQQSPPPPPPDPTPPPHHSGGGGSFPGGGGGGGTGPGHHPMLMQFRPVVDPTVTDLLAQPVSVETVRAIKTKAKLGFGDVAMERPFADTNFGDQAALKNAIVAITAGPEEEVLAPAARGGREVPATLARALAADAALARAARVTIPAGALQSGDRPLRDVLAAVRISELAFAGGVELTSHDFSLDAEVCLVNLRRPWMSSAFLQLRNWFVQSFDRGELASGNPEDGSPLAAIAVGCVLVRNVRIHAEWSGADQAQSLASTHLGPFSLAGRRFDTTSATLSIPGMQSVAWVCQPMPVLPPRPSLT